MAKAKRKSGAVPLDDEDGILDGMQPTADPAVIAKVEKRIAQTSAITEKSPTFRRIVLDGEPEPSEYQWNIYERISTTEDSFQTKAVAGSGKTKVLQGIALRSGLNKQMLAVAFNRHNAKTFEERMPMVTSSTIHALCLATFKRATKYLRFTKDSVDAEDGKIKEIVKQLKIPQQLPTYESWEVEGMYRDIIHYMMVGMVPPVAEAIEQMAEDFTVTLPAKTDLIAEHAAQIFKFARELAFGSNGGVPIINFDEMIYWPVMEQMRFEPFHTVAVDEAQDLNELQHNVLSLIPCSRRIPVGDPNQAIMMFAGAKNDSMDALQKRFNLDSMPLNLNYRCGKNIIKKAQSIVPHLQTPDWQIDGEVLEIPKRDLRKSLTNGCFVLCRMNAPLVSLCFKLIQEGVRARIRGRDMSRMFGKLIRQIAGRDQDTGNFPIRLEQWKEKEAQRLFQYGGKRIAALLGYLQDKAECLMAFYDNIAPSRYDEFIKGVGYIFSDESTASVNLMSCHASKGLEAEDVFILHPEKLPLTWNGQSEAQFQQEMNLLYVAITRAMKRLIFVRTDGGEDD